MAMLAAGDLRFTFKKAASAILCWLIWNSDV
jgi:hypothetical protein